MACVFLCLLLLAGLQAHAATLSDVNKLVELLNRQLQLTRNVPENSVDGDSNLSGEPAMPPASGFNPVMGESPMTPEKPEYPEVPAYPTSPGEDYYYGLVGHGRCDSYIRDLFNDIYRIPVGEEMIDHISNNQKYAEAIMSILDMVRDLPDREGVIMLTVRRFVKTLLEDRLRCPAAVLERYIMAYMRREEYKLLRHSDSMFSALVPVLSDIPHIGAGNISVETLARLVSSDTHNWVFNETMDGIITWALDDVISVAKQLRVFLREHYEAFMNMDTARIPMILENFLNNTMYWVYCPSIYDVGFRHGHAFYELRKNLMNIDKDNLCYDVEEFIERYVPEPSLHGVDETTYRTAMDRTCYIVGGYMDKLVVRLENLEKSIQEGERPEKFVGIISPYFEKNEIDLLMLVLEKVGWPMNGPQNPDLMISDVIQHEENDVKHWTNLMETLTPEKFDAMTLDDFFGVVNQWLTEKYARIETYKKYQNISPGY